MWNLNWLATFGHIDTSHMQQVIQLLVTCLKSENAATQYEALDCLGKLTENDKMSTYIDDDTLDNLFVKIREGLKTSDKRKVFQA